jgi:hypothetical protein
MSTRLKKSESGYRTFVAYRTHFTDSSWYNGIIFIEAPLKQLSPHPCLLLLFTSPIASNIHSNLKNVLLHIAINVREQSGTMRYKGFPVAMKGINFPLLFTLRELL